VAVFLMAFLALAAAPGGAPPPAPAARARASVHMEIGVWGKERFSWTIDEDGEGEMREAGLEDEAGNHDVSIWRLHEGKAGFAEIEALMRPIVAAYAGKGIKCDFTTPDGPQGTLSWRFADGAGVLSVYYGCHGGDGDRAFPLINKVDGAVTARAKAHKPEVRHVAGDSAPLP
jgi:hypothetical protein